MDRQPRLLQVCLSRSWGGLEMVAFELARDMDSRGIDIVTACPADSRLGERLREVGLPVIDIDARKYFDPGAVVKLRRALRERGITNVVLQQLRDIWHMRPALMGFNDVRLSGFAHIFLSVRKRSAGHAFLYHRLDDLICLTEIQRRNFAEHLPVPLEKIQVVPNSVDMQRFSPDKRSDATRASLGAKAANEVLIGVLGRLDQAKGQLETVEAAKRLAGAGLPFRIALVGEETLNLKGTKALLEEKIHQLDVGPWVNLTGYRSDIPEIVASLDILAMPSWAETFGRVLLEAMASKTVVVATRAGGVPDIVSDGVDGLLVEPRDGRSLAEALINLVRNPGLRARLSEAGYRKARESYDLHRVRSQRDAILLAQRRR